MSIKYFLTDEIIFDAKNDAVPYNYRISYKIAQLCLILFTNCGKGGCSLIKLHMISMAMCTNKDMTKILNFAEDSSQTYTLIRFDPAVNRAVKYALADNIIYQQANGYFKLTEKGRTFANSIKKDAELMVREKSFLDKLSNKLTEDRIKNLMSFWREQGANNK